MPNNGYLRSRKREQQIVAEARAKGWIAARSAGSKSPVDCWLFDPKKLVLYMIQVKTKKGGRGLLMIDKKTYENVTVIERWHHYA